MALVSKENEMGRANARMTSYSAAMIYLDRVKEFMQEKAQRWRDRIEQLDLFWSRDKFDAAEHVLVVDIHPELSHQQQQKSAWKVLKARKRFVWREKGSNVRHQLDVACLPKLIADSENASSLNMALWELEDESEDFIKAGQRNAAFSFQTVESDAGPACKKTVVHRFTKSTVNPVR